MAAFFRARFARVASKYGGGISEWLAEPNAQSTGSRVLLKSMGGMGSMGSMGKLI